MEFLAMFKAKTSIVVYIIDIPKRPWSNLKWQPKKIRVFFSLLGGETLVSRQEAICKLTASRLLAIIYSVVVGFDAAACLEAHWSLVICNSSIDWLVFKTRVVMNFSALLPSCDYYF